MSFIKSPPFEVRPTTLFPLWNHDAKGVDPGGVPVRPLGFITNQNRMALPTWSFAMEKYPPARIVEIGSYNGGFTCALAVHAWNIGAKVYGFDVSQIPNVRYKPLADFLGISWFQMDCFTDGFPLIEKLIQSPGVTYLLCDGGNKIKEMLTFAPLLKVGDVIAAHDYDAERRDWWGWGEICKADVAQMFEVVLSGPRPTHCWEPFMQEYFDFAAWLAYKRL